MPGPVSGELHLWTLGRARQGGPEVRERLHEVVDLCLSRKDYTTHNFMQWYVAEQIEEEALARTILDKLALIGTDSAGLYLFDRDLENLEPEESKD